LAFSPIPGEVSHPAHQALWFAELAWFLYENRQTIRALCLRYVFRRN
jgi:hypothetical protein